jgi:hypothetical protein
MRMATIVEDSVIAYNNDDLFANFIAFVQKQVPIAVQELSVMCGLTINYDCKKG